MYHQFYCLSLYIVHIVAFFNCLIKETWWWWWSKDPFTSY